MHVLMAASELHPFSKTGGLADAVAALAAAVADAGLEVSVVTPRYRAVPEKAPGLRRIGWRFGICPRLSCNLLEAPFHAKVNVQIRTRHWN